MADLPALTPEAPYYLDSSGSVVQVPPEQTADAAAMGWTPAEPEQIASHLAQQKYGDTAGVLKAGAAAAARALTLGLSDQALTRTGLVEPETLQGLKEANPTADLIGTGIGIAAPIIATMGAAAPAEAGAQAAVRGAAELTAPSLIARAGRAVTGAVEGVLPEAEGFLGRVVNRAVSTGAGSAIEGAAYGAGQVVSEQALGDPNLTAQSALATIGLSAALGGGLGGLLGAASEAVPAAISKASDAIGGAVQKAKEVYPEVAERLTGGAVTAEQVREAQTKFAQAFTDPKKINKLVQDLGEHMEGVANEVEAAKRTMYAEARPAETEKLLSMADPATLGPAAVEQREKVVGMLSTAIDEARQDPDLITGRVVGELEKIRDGFARRTESGAPLDVFENLRAARQQIDGLSAWAKVNRDLPPLAQRNATTLARSLRGAVRDVLTDESAWGPAAARQSALDELNTTYMRAFDTLTKGKLGPLNANILPKAMVDGQEAFRLNPRALRTALNQMGDVRGDQVAEAVFSYLDAAKKYVHGMEETYSHLPTSSFDKNALSGLIDETGKLTGQAQIQASATRFLRELDPNAGLARGGANALLPPAGNTEAMGGLGTLAMAPIIGHMVPGAGPVAALYGAGKAIYHGLEGLKNVPQTVATLARLERMTQQVSASIDRNASMLVRGSARAGAITRPEVLAGVAREFGASQESSLARFNRRVQEVQRLSSDPAKLADTLAEQASSLAPHAPNTAQALNIASARAVAFLTAKLPQHPQRGPLAPEWEPSRSEMAKFARYYEAVQDPLVIFKQAAAGVLTPEAVEAVQVVYPELYGRIQQSLVEKMAGNRTAVPARSRIALSGLLGQDLDGRLGMLNANQATYAAPSRKQDAAPQASNRPTSKGLGNLSLSQRSLTPMQATAQRRL